MGQICMPTRSGSVDLKLFTHSAVVRNDISAHRWPGDMGVNWDMENKVGQTIYITPDYKNRKGIWFDGSWFWNDVWLKDITPISQVDSQFYQYEEE